MKNKLNIILIGLIVFFCVYSIQSNAVDIEIAAGQSIYTKSDNGVWWQDPFPNKFNLTPITYSIGLSQSLNDWLRIKVGFTDLGPISGYSEDVADDANYNGHGCNDPCLPLSKLYMEGRVTGVYFLLSPEYKFYKDWSMFLDLGTWNYKPEFNVDIPNLYPNYTSAPVHVTLTHQPDREWGRVLGAGITYKQIMFAYRVYGSSANDDLYPALYQGFTQTMTLGYRF